MLGWFISVYTVADNCPPEWELTFDVKNNRVPLIRWSTGLYRLSWLDELCKNAPDSSKFLGGNGYPLKYITRAGLVKKVLLEGTNLSWRQFKDVDCLPESGGEGQRNSKAIQALTEEEWLVIEAFDES